MLAWYHLVANRDQAALARVAELAQAQRDERYPLSMVQNLALVARAHQALGRQDQAAAEISQCLALGEPMGLVRTFVDHGEPMAQLLAAAAAQRELPAGSGYVARLLEAVKTARPAAPATSPQPPASQALFEPLRPREIEVLQQVAVGHSNSEIADQMVMAVSTVKWYLRIIYGKLQVHRRTQAVARAKELDLI
jgi:LuxR family maltose regulon positive regulatory protein